MNALRTSLLIVLLVAAARADAVIETYQFSEPALKMRYQQLSAELRCPKCQNQNIADSNAPISQDLRKLLHQQLEAGASDDEILDYMVARYGEFVRYRPSYTGATAILWVAPALLLLAAIGVTLLVLRGRRKPDAAESHLSDEEQARVRDLLAESEQNS